MSRALTHALTGAPTRAPTLAGVRVSRPPDKPRSSEPQGTFAVAMLDCGGRIVESNPTLRRLFGGNGVGLVGRPLLGRVAGFAGIAAQIEQRGWCRLQAAWRRHDGRLIWCDCIVTPILRPDGRPRGYASVIRDITDEHRQMLERIKVGLPGCGSTRGGAT